MIQRPMSDEFYHRFGSVELGPKNGPRYGQELYERTQSGLEKRYTLENGWAVDTSGNRAFRLGDKGRVFLPNGREIARPKMLPASAPDTTPQRLFGRASKLRSQSPPVKPTIAQRMFGGRAR